MSIFRYIAYSLPFLLMGCSSGSSELLDAVEEEDHQRVVELLQAGANPLTTVGSRGSPLKAALTKISGLSPSEQFPAEQMTFNLPKIAIMRDVMNAVRDRESEKVEKTGVIEHLLQLSPFDPNGPMVGVSYFYLIPDDGSAKLEFIYTIMETQFIGFGESSARPAVPLNTKVRFEGYWYGDYVEATQIEVLSPGFDGDSYRTSANYFHESTMHKMVAETWIEFVDES